MIHPDDLTLQSWHDDELDAAQRAEVSTHVEGCEVCAAKVEGLGMVARASQQWLDAAPALPDDFADLLMARLEREAPAPVEAAAPRPLAPVVPLRPTVKAAPSRRWVYPALAAAAAGIIAVRVALPSRPGAPSMIPPVAALVGGEHAGGAKVTRVDIPGAQSFTVMQLPGVRPDSVTAVVWIQDRDELGDTQ